MPVKVTDNYQETIEHNEAQHVEIRDGHLIVLSQAGVGGDVLAVYAPGHWHNATAARNARVS